MGYSCTLKVAWKRVQVFSNDPMTSNPPLLSMRTKVNDIIVPHPKENLDHDHLDLSPNELLCDEVSICIKNPIKPF